MSEKLEVDLGRRPLPRLLVRLRDRLFGRLFGRLHGRLNGRRSCRLSGSVWATRSHFGWLLDVQKLNLVKKVAVEWVGDVTDVCGREKQNP